MPSSRHASLPPDIEAIFKKLFTLLEDDNEQNSKLPELLRAPIAGGLSCDELPNAHGEFGRTPSWRMKLRSSAQVSRLAFGI